MFEAAVDGFGGAACGVGVVEVGQYVPGSAFECPSQRHERSQAPRYARGAHVLMSACIRALPALALGAR